MELQNFAGLSHSLQTVAVAVAVFVLCTYIPRLKTKSQLARLPGLFSGGGEKVRQEYLKSSKNMHIQAYKKFKNVAYRMIAEDGDDHVVIPPMFLPEVRKLPDDVLSFPKATATFMEAKYTGLLTESSWAIHSIKADLTPALPRLSLMISDEVNSSMRQYMPSCSDWTEVAINQVFVDVVTKVSGRIFVGPELSSDPGYLEAASNYTYDLMNAVYKIKAINPWLRPLLAPRCKEVRQLREREQRAEEYFRPLVEERVNARETDPNWQAPDDMLQWMINRAPKNITLSEIARSQLILTFAAIHTTTMTATNIVFSLAVTPEYIEPLREEIRNAMADNNGQITTRTLQQLVKMDSYMKEVTRHYPASVTSFTRYVTKGFTLSNGQYIPAGTYLEVPSQAVYLDSAHYPKSEEFDGFRHYNLRSGGTASDHARNQFVTTNETNMGFGYGKHACPGRFFAANEIKMILARLILEYDIMMPGGSLVRHKQMEIGRTIVPNPEGKVMLRKVEV